MEHSGLGEVKRVHGSKSTYSVSSAEQDIYTHHSNYLRPHHTSLSSFQSPTTAMATASPSYMLAMASPELMYAQMPPYQPAELTDATVLESAGVEVMAHPFAL